MEGGERAGGKKKGGGAELTFRNADRQRDKNIVRKGKSGRDNYIYTYRQRKRKIVE